MGGEKLKLPSSRGEKRKKTHPETTPKKSYWGPMKPPVILRGCIAGGIHEPTDSTYCIPSVTSNSATKLAVYGSKLGLGFKFDEFNSPCGLGSIGEPVDYRKYPTPMLNERPSFKIMNMNSTEHAILHAVSVG